jgi:hypothetical protein
VSHLGLRPLRAKLPEEGEGEQMGNKSEISLNPNPLILIYEYIIDENCDHSENDLF